MRTFALLALLVALPACTPSSDDSATSAAVPSGQLVDGFGSGGVALSDPSVRGDAAAAARVWNEAGGDRLLVVGSDEAPAAGDHQWRIEKWCY